MKKTALVTGAATGIGQAAALRLAQDGCNVAVNVHGTAGDETVRLCREAGAVCESFSADVSDFEQCAQMVKAVTARFGSLDILVNNAGITKDGLLARMSEASFDAVIAVNLKGVFNMCRHTSGVMIKQRSGRIINVSSVVGLYGNAGQFNYAASKAGIIGMTLTAAKELGGRGITVNAVAPGFIETNMTASLPQNVKEAMLGQISLKHFGKPQDVAAAVAFFASDSAAYITGQVLAVDGCILM
ncbi:MAG: 3-oxoacyl-[acyl-carrier-protein] reductase [Hydrogenoanaerobacterium sp.]